VSKLDSPHRRIVDQEVQVTQIASPGASRLAPWSVSKLEGPAIKPCRICDKDFTAQSRTQVFCRRLPRGRGNRDEGRRRHGGGVSGDNQTSTHRTPQTVKIAVQSPVRANPPCQRSAHNIDASVAPTQTRRETEHQMTAGMSCTISSAVRDPSSPPARALSRRRCGAPPCRRIGRGRSGHADGVPGLVCSCGHYGGANLGARAGRAFGRRVRG
jgi:hypothetical protein